MPTQRVYTLGRSHWEGARKGRVALLNLEFATLVQCVTFGILGTQIESHTPSELCAVIGLKVSVEP